MDFKDYLVLPGTLSDQEVNTNREMAAVRSKRS
jgi:hypothetical protein